MFSLPVVVEPQDEGAETEETEETEEMEEMEETEETAPERDRKTHFIRICVKTERDENLNSLLGAADSESETHQPITTNSSHRLQQPTSQPGEAVSQQVISRYGSGWS